MTASVFFDSHLCLPTTLDALKQTAGEYIATHGANCQQLLSVASDVALFERNTALRSASVAVACAVHPLYCRLFDEQTLTALTTRWWPLQDAIGEIGLDFHAFDASLNYADRDTQTRVFVQQLTAALPFAKPLILHTREADDETFEILDRLVPRDHCALVVHCFSSPSPAFVRRLLHRFDNVFFGVAGNVTFGGKKNAALVETIRDEIPLERLLLETDAPFLCPVRGATNHSGHLDAIARRLAELKRVDRDALIAATTANAWRFLGKLPAGSIEN